MEKLAILGGPRAVKSDPGDTQADGFDKITSVHNFAFPLYFFTKHYSFYLM